jgi:hypothetical protein
MHGSNPNQFQVGWLAPTHSFGIGLRSLHNLLFYFFMPILQNNLCANQSHYLNVYSNLLYLFEIKNIYILTN